MKQFQNVLIVIVALIAFVIGMQFYQGKTKKEYAETTYVYEPARALATFSMTTHTGEAFKNDALTGKWSFIFLGYLSCPDVCPMTMAKFSRLIPRLNALPDVASQVLFVSVDPKRDTLASIGEYVGYFHEDVIGLWGEHVNLFPFVRSLGLMYSLPPQSDDDGYFVDHSASIILTNPDGQIAAIFKPDIQLNQVPTVDMDIIYNDFVTLLE